MNIEEQITTREFAHWEYVVDDFMEMACFLTPEQRRQLLHEMLLHRCTSEKINVHPSFTTDKHLIVILEGVQVEECWLYYPEGGNIEKYPLKKKK